MKNLEKILTSIGGIIFGFVLVFCLFGMARTPDERAAQDSEIIPSTTQPITLASSTMTWFETTSTTLTTSSTTSTTLTTIEETTTTTTITTVPAFVISEDKSLPEEIIETTTEAPQVEENLIENNEIEEEILVEDDSSSSEISSENLRLLGSLKITGYVATGNPTASGEMPYVGGVAMSRNYGLPFGTQIYIEGLGYYTINDTGCKYGVVDVFCGSISECYNLTSYANVYVVE